jgi:CRP-like cAMP-binding protein
MLTQNRPMTGSNKSSLPDPKKNQLLATFFQSGWRQCEPHLEPFEMTLGQVLYEAGSRSEYVYFPITGIVSLQHPMADGALAEIAAVDDQGIVGVGLLVGHAGAPSRAVVRSAGTGYRLKAHMVREELDRAGPVMDAMLRYSQTLLAQMVQSAARFCAAT